MKKIAIFILFTSSFYASLSASAELPQESSYTMYSDYPGGPIYYLTKPVILETPQKALAASIITQTPNYNSLQETFSK